MTVAILGTVERERSGLAAGVLNVARQTGSVIGVAVLGGLLGSPANVAGVRLGSFVGAIALGLAGMLAGAAVLRRGPAGGAKVLGDAVADEPGIASNSVT
jgi:MFS transporter, DHA2 family, methylenomycin A resistance protein